MEKKLLKIREMTLPKIEELGFNLYHLEYLAEIEEEGKSLRFHIQHKDGSQVSLDDCESVSRTVSEIIDADDPIDEPYYLEIQSAGDFRQLFTDEHYNEVLGQRVIVNLKNKIKGSLKFNGELKENREDAIVVATEKEEIEIKKENLDSVSLNPQV